MPGVDSPLSPHELDSITKGDVMKNLMWAFAIFMAAGITSALAASYTLTKYDDPAFAQFCNAQLRYPNHFDGAVTDGVWGLCVFSDRGPGAVVHNSALYEHTANGWVLAMKGNGYIDVSGLEGAGVPVDAAQRLFGKLLSDVCFRGDIPGTQSYCASR